MKAQTKALIASVVVIALALSAVSGITYSWWSDSESTDITVNTGYVDVKTDNFTITKGGVTVPNVSGSIPGSFSIVYGDDQTRNDSYWTSGSNAKLTINGNPSEEIVISYSATFYWSVAAKYMINVITNDIPDTEVAVYSDDTHTHPVSGLNSWYIPTTTEASPQTYYVVITIDGLSQNLTNAELEVINTITQAKSDAWDGITTTPVTPEGNTYKIYTPAELAWFSQQVRSLEYFSDKIVQLESDIDLGGYSWIPIGAADDSSPGNPYLHGFEGTFDGNGHTISGLNVSSTPNDVSGAGYGLFSYLDGTIKNLNLNGAIITGDHFIGGIVGYFEKGTIENCTVKDSRFTNRDVNTNGDGDKTGAIAGYVNGGVGAKINSCTVENVILTGARDIGGITGCISGTGSFLNTNTVSDVTINIDQTGYTSSRTMNAGKVVGRLADGAVASQLTNNTATNVDIIVPVSDIQTLQTVLSNWGCFNGATARLTQDIDASGFTWTAPSETSNETNYVWSIDGNEKTISHLSGSLLGQFAGDTISVKDLSLTDGNMTVSYGSGNRLGFGAIIAGFQSQIGSITISGCTVSNYVMNTNAKYAGGLIGITNVAATISNCAVTGCVITGGQSVGGLVGFFGTPISSFSDCTSSSNNLTTTCSEWEVGTVFGKTNASGSTFTGIQSSNNTLTQEINTKSSAGVDYAFGCIVNAVITINSTSYGVNPGITMPVGI